MTEKRKPGDEGPVEAWDDEGGAAEPDVEAPDQARDEAPDEVERARRWAEEHTGHWHGAKSSDATQDRADEG